jgi:medium-chain acyl-[acyl-carrier-protein] hydrolase
MNGKMVYTDTFHLTAGDFDQYMRLKPYTIFNFFQEVASIHAARLNLGYDEMLQKNRAWILLRSKYIILQQPELSSKVLVETWPLPAHKVEYRREFRITDANHNLLVKGTSTWCVVDVVTKRISRDHLLFNGEYYLETNFDESLEQLPNIDLNQEMWISKHQVRASDIDRYQHMNNAKYSEIVFDALNLSAQEVIKQVQINFINEVKLNETIEIYKTNIGNNYYIVGCVKEKVSFRAFVKTNIVES